MATVVEELPFAAVVRTEKLDTVCSNCFAVKSVMNKVDVKKCARCRIIHYCCKQCQVDDWVHHKYECGFLLQGGMLPPQGRLLSRMIMRVKRGDVPVAFNGHTFDDLIDNMDDLTQILPGLNVPIYLIQAENLRQSLVPYMGAENVPPPEKLVSFDQKRNFNALDIFHESPDSKTSRIGLALYIGVMAHKHSCRPTADCYFNGSKIVLCAKDPNAGYSKDLTFSYIPLELETRKTRQDLMSNSFYFNCNCERCMDKETALLELSGKSACCPAEGAVLPVDNKQPLVCTNCGKEASITLEEINSANEKLEGILEKECGKGFGRNHSKSSVGEQVKLLKKMETVLSPYNIHLLKFMQFVGARYTVTSCGDLSLETKHDLAEKKAMEKYGIVSKSSQINYMRGQFRAETLEPFKNRCKANSAKLDAAIQKALNTVKEVYGSEHPLYRDMEEYSAMIKAKYDGTDGGRGGCGMGSTGNNRKKNMRAGK